jgi:predicted peroxiredoxin
MKKLVSKIALVAILSVPTLGFASSKSVMTIVTSPNPQTQLMAMVLSVKSMMKGVKVDILLCGPAGDIATKGSKEVKLKPKNMSAQMLLKKMIKKGVDVKVCPLYLPNKGKTKADLIKGISVANPNKMADMLLEDGKVVLTY